MLPFLNLIRRLFSNGVRIKKYLQPVKLLLVLFNRVKKIKRLFKDPLFSLGIISIILFIILSATPFLKSFPEVAKTSFYLPEYFSSQNLFLSSANKFLVESPNFLLVEKSSLRAATPPSLVSPQVLGVLVGKSEPEEAKKVIREYIVESEDTLSSLAEKFEISLNTILWANDLTKKSIIKPGQKLIIPPVSGVIHHVKSGDTLSEIAKTYKGKIEEIISFNELSNENDIYIGDVLIIPDGVMPPPSAKPRPAPIRIPLADSQFILPVSSPYIFTQGLHWYNAVDFSHSGYACGKPVFAAGGGLVQKTGYDRILGNYVRILHPNGVVTLYGHLSAITIKKGESVNIGEIIGYIGNTGRTKGLTGCHLHFEVRGAKNPFAR
ncbi:MAG: LysM peptidoglycan-binding domain-containing protein [Patescibacteria group bacterium]|nr:LysM peptidoglycan-binding domain-containing protein [Patescibacteria group bacterium]